MRDNLVCKINITIVFAILFAGNLLYSSINFSSQSSKIQLNNSSNLNIRTAITDWKGTLRKKTGGVITGSSISFDEGILYDESGSLELTAAYDPSGARKLSLSGTKTVRANPGTFINKLNVSGIQNWFMGQPLFLNSDSVQLTDADTELTIAVQSDFNSNITMNGGKIKLDNDLKFSDDRSFSGLGSVELRGHQLEFGGKDLTLTNSLYWQSAEDINLNSRVSLSGTWTFGGNSVLNGHGNVLDLTSGGTLYVDSNSTLNLTDIAVKGLGSTNGWFVFKDNTSSIKMSNVTVELDNSFTVSVGGIYIDGPSTFVLKNNNFVFDQYGTLTVDGMTLWKEYAAYNSTGNEGDILFGNESTEKVLINDGAISAVATDLAIRYNSNAIVTHDREISYNSSAIVVLEEQVKDNSNAIVNLEDQVEANSNAIMWHDEQIRWNSNAIENNENLEDLTRYNSNAIVTHDKEIENNSNAVLNLEDQVEANSNAIMWHDEQIRWNSNAIENNENLEDLTRYNSNAIVTHDKEIENNSNAVLNLEDQVEANSNTIMWHDEQIRWNSNAIVSADFTTLTDLVRENSNAIEFMSDVLETATNDISYNSSAIVVLEEQVKDNSNAIVNLEDQVEANSNAIMWHDEQIRWNSNAIVSLTSADFAQDIKENSNAIVSFSRDVADKFVSEDGAKLYVTNGTTGDTTYDGKVFISELINLNGGTLNMGGDGIFSAKTTIVSSGNLQLNGNALVFGNDLTLPDGVDLKFVNSGIFDGQGHSLIFEGNSRIRFDQNTTVTLRNIKLYKVKNHSDGSSSINLMNSLRSQLTLENADLYLDRDMSFTQGQLYMHGDVSINGTNQFNYTSTKDAFITSNASLLLDSGITFSYGPSTSDDRTLIKMTDVSSILYLNGATLKSTTTGLILSKGSLVVDGRNYIYNEDGTGAATSLSQAVAFGDGTNDLNVEIMPGGSIELMSGILDV